ncbi:MAG TPA: type II CAAX endopeptidase family protein [Candidatus Acidoferrales bacterium]|nr:type II CAAX endopeptidase family protein [Candidatus Acidoferrales bacterium]
MDEPTSPASEPEPPRGPSPSLFPMQGQSPVFYGPNGLRAGWRLLAFLATLSVLFSAVMMALRFFRHAPFRGEITPGAALLGEGVPLLLVLLGSWIMSHLERRTLADYGLPAWGAFGAKFWLGGVFGFLSISALLAAIYAAHGFHLDGLALRGASLWKYALLWAAVFVVVGLFEEFFFRGYMLFTLTTGIGFWPAALALSALFGYVHHGNSGETWLGAFNAGLVGLLFCLLLRRTGDLWMAIGFHAAWDWGETYCYGVADSGQVAAGHLLNASFAGPQWITGGTVGPEGSYLCTALLVVLFAIFAVLLRTVKYPNPASITGRVSGAPAFDL